MKNNYTKEQAIQYSEGNEILKQVLFLCLEKDIRTEFCCAGHFIKDFESLKEKYPERCEKMTEEEYLKRTNGIFFNDSSYISFGIGEDEKNFLAYMLNDENFKSIVRDLSFEKWANHGEKFSIYAKNFDISAEKIFNEKTADFFGFILEKLKNFEKGEKYDSPLVNFYAGLSKKSDDFVVAVNSDELIVIQSKQELNLKHFKPVEKWNDYLFRYEVSIQNLKSAVEELKKIVNLSVLGKTL